MPLRFLHTTVWINSSFIVVAEWYSSVRMSYSLFIHSHINGLVGCFHSSDDYQQSSHLCTNLGVNMSIYLPRYPAGSHGKYMINFIINWKVISGLVLPFGFLPTMDEGSSYSISSPAFGVRFGALFYVCFCLSRSNRCVIILALICISIVADHFKHLFCVFICHSYSFYSEIAVQIFAYFLIHYLFPCCWFFSHFVEV